jgi:hypothetical protein
MDEKPKKIVVGYIEPIRLSAIRARIALDELEGGRRGRGEMPDQDDDRSRKRQNQEPER